MAFNASQPRDKDGRWSALGYYIDGNNMNIDIRAGDLSNPNIEKLDEIIAENGTTTTDELYRGAGSDYADILAEQVGSDAFLTDDDYADYTETFKGVKLKDAGYLSTTTDEFVALDLTKEDRRASGVFFIIKAKGKSLDIVDVMGDKVSWEKERLFPRNTELTITRAYTENRRGNSVLTIEAEAN